MFWIFSLLFHLPRPEFHFNARRYQYINSITLLIAWLSKFDGVKFIGMAASNPVFYFACLPYQDRT